MTRRAAAVSELATVIPAAFESVYRFMREAKLPSGQNVIVYRARGEERVELSCGVLVSEKFEAVGDITCDVTPAGQAVTSTHEGPYERLHESHDALLEWARTSQLRLAPVSWEVYGAWSDDPAALRTELFHLLDT